MGAGRQPGRAQRSPSRARFLPIALFLCYASWLYLWSSSQGQAERRAARARESAATAAAAVVALGGQAPLLHGPVNKTGTLAQDRWHPRHVAEINRKFLRWVSRRAQRGVHRSALSPHVSPGCAVWASHAYKTIFVRHAKAASTSVLSIFTLCNEPHAKPSCLEQWNGGFKNRASVRNSTAADIDAMWRDYFVFTVVRNPLARAVSSYKFVLSSMNGTRDECLDLMDWDDFCADPALAGMACRAHRECCPFSPIFSFAHILDQTRCMTTAAGGLVVDFVARTEQLSADMAEVLAQINRRRPPGVPALDIPARMPHALPSDTIQACTEVQPATQHRAAARPASFFGVTHNFSSIVAKEASYCGLQRFYSGPHERCVRSIRRVYGADLRLLYPDALERLPSNATDPG